MASADLAIAAYAAGDGSARSAMMIEHSPVMHDSSPYELPSVDDLEVAAAAAAAALEVLQGPCQSSDSSIDSSDDSSDAGSGGTDSDDDLSTRGAGAASPDHPPFKSTQPGGPLKLHINVDDKEPGNLTVTLLVEDEVSTLDLGDAEVEIDLSPVESSDSDGGDDDGTSTSSSEAASMDMDEMRDMIRKAYEVEEEDEGEGVAAANLASSVLCLQEGQEVIDVDLQPDDVLEVAGKVTAVVEGVAVVQCPANGRALDLGTVLISEDRKVVGCVEEVFGPVTAPYYALRSVGKDCALSPGMPLFFVTRLASYVPLDQDQPRRLKASEALGVDDKEEDDEVCFSDDEKEAEYLKSQLSSKRKQGDARSTPGSDMAASRQDRSTRQRGGAQKQGPGRGGRGGARGGRGGSDRGGGGGHERMQFQAQATAGVLSTIDIGGEKQRGGASNSRGRHGGGTSPHSASPYHPANAKYNAYAHNPETPSPSGYGYQSRPPPPVYSPQQHPLSGSEYPYAQSPHGYPSGTLHGNSTPNCDAQGGGGQFSPGQWYGRSQGCYTPSPGNPPSASPHSSYSGNQHNQMHPQNFNAYGPQVYPQGSPQTSYNHHAHGEAWQSPNLHYGQQPSGYGHPPLQGYGPQSLHGYPQPPQPQQGFGSQSPQGRSQQLNQSNQSQYNQGMPGYGQQGLQGYNQSQQGYPPVPPQGHGFSGQMGQGYF